MKKYTYSDEIANVVKTFLTEDDWHYSFDEKTGIFTFGLRLRSKIQHIKYLIDVHEDEAVVYSIPTITADSYDSEMMARMAEFICRANYNLKNGNFEMDYRDGEIRFKSYIDCDNLTPSTAVVKNAVYCAATMFKRYAPGITDIIFADSTAKDAIAKCEESKADVLRRMLAQMEEDSDEDGTSESCSDDEEMSDMLERLAELIGITESGNTSGGENSAAS